MTNNTDKSISTSNTSTADNASEHKGSKATSDSDVYIDDRELARMLSCSRITLQQARAKGEGIPYIKIGRLVRYSTRTVREWLTAHTRGSLQSQAPRA
jgi:predicted DNA-binding transcriptional regulator AlpA